MSWRELVNVLAHASGGRCSYCGARFSHEQKPTVDHVIPLRLGGTREADNLKAACRSCNTSKHLRDLDDWRAAIACKLAGIPSFTPAQEAWLAAHGFQLPPPPPASTVRFYFEDKVRGGWCWEGGRGGVGARKVSPRDREGGGT